MFSFFFENFHFFLVFEILINLFNNLLIKNTLYSDVGKILLGESEIEL